MAGSRVERPESTRVVRAQGHEVGRLKQGPTAAQIAEAEHYDKVGGTTTERDVDYADGGIVGQLQSLADQLSKSYAVLNVLVGRIDPILLPEEDGPMTAAGYDDMIPRKSEVARMLDDLHGQSRRLQYRMAEVTERVQL